MQNGSTTTLTIRNREEHMGSHRTQMNCAWDRLMDATLSDYVKIAL